ncbi:hypothetical protein BH20CHL7_BH20CHL7_07050 [soil metagenome]
MRRHHRPDAGGVTITGALYVDVVVDLPCAEQQGPSELSGVGLTFTDRTGVVLRRAATGLLQVQDLPPGRPGTDGWANTGCRSFAAYSVTTVPVEAYRVEFNAAPPRVGPGGGYFQGVQELAPQAIAHDELAAMAFTWTFEVPPSYAVP